MKTQNKICAYMSVATILMLVLSTRAANICMSIDDEKDSNGNTELVNVFNIPKLKGESTFTAHETPIKNIILISWDGAQRNHTLELLQQGKLGNLSTLIDDGSFTDVYIPPFVKVENDVAEFVSEDQISAEDVVYYECAVTDSGHARMLTGRWNYETGIYKPLPDNPDANPLDIDYICGNNFETVKDSLTIMEKIATYDLTDEVDDFEIGVYVSRHSDLRSFANQSLVGRFYGWGGDDIYILVAHEGFSAVGAHGFYNTTFLNAESELDFMFDSDCLDQYDVDDVHLPVFNVTSREFVFGGEIRYNVVATKAAEFVSATYARNKNFFLFVHFCEPDLFGHFYGENSAEYSRAIISNDEGVGIIINKLKELDIYDDTLVIVTTDHGAKENSKNATFISGPQGRKWLVGLGPLHGQKDMDNHLIWMVNNKYVLSETILHTQIAHIILNALGIPTSTPVFDLFFQKGISFSGDFVENSVLNINGTVGNDGIFPAYNFTVQLLINNNPIENKTYSLTPNGSVEVSFNWAAEPGNHNIIILIDPLDKFREYNETNNSAIANLYIHSLPDLSIFNEDIIFSNNEPIENDTIYINATVHIESELPIAENITVEFVMDNETLNTQEIFIRMNSTVNVSFFWTAIKGTHNITIKVDSTNTVSESNETNNEATKQITVQPKTPPAPTPQIDLFITSSDITFSNDNPREEDNVTITATVHAVNLTENISIAVELLIDSNLKANRTVLISNASITIQFNWTAVKGEHNITIEIDTTNVVTESNETNNIATREISVMARAAPPPPGEPSEIPWFYLGIALAMIVAIIAVAISVLFIMRKKMGKKKGNHDV